MGFNNFDKDEGLNTLDGFLLDKSYIQGYTPSQADTVVFQALASAPAAKFVNALRWYNHIASFRIADTKLFPGEKKALSAYGPGASAPVAAKTAPAAAKKPAAKEEEDDDDLDLFGSDDEEDAENEKLKAERVMAYNAKKAAKPKTIAKSMVTLDVKPWDDETDMEALKKNVLEIKMEGLTWGTSKFVAVGYGIKKLAVTCVVVDDLVGVDDLIDLITADEEHVQSVDIASFNKL